MVQQLRRLDARLLTVFVMVGVLAGLGTYTFYYARGYSYLSDNPQACVNCHIMREQYDGWAKSSHHSVATCNSCHVPHDIVGKYATKAENGFWHSYYFTFQNFHYPIQMRPQSRAILQENCLYCHGQFVGNVAAHSADSQIDCVKCHQGVGHDPTR
ncbi:MAG: cytochrome c nitrite reductase small subunit [Chloroflexota bacterium]|jgi:cytochrome c nitrite reductase small subunit